MAAEITDKILSMKSVEAVIICKEDQVLKTAAMTNLDLPGFGEELLDLEFDGVSLYYLFHHVLSHYFVLRMTIPLLPLNC